MRIRAVVVWMMLVVGATLARETARAEDDVRSSRAVAVGLNYCRASFHRLRRNPSKRVMFEEQTKILNNLNLNGIGEQDVVTLYTAVLDEIAKEQIAEKEKKVIKEGYQLALRQDLLNRAFVLGAQVSTTQYVAAIRTGCSSWWDYRNLGMGRDVDLWKVDKARMGEVVDKSSRFLDTFWKLAQKRNIQDDWLVRDDDLEKLESALAENSPAVRLRVLQRMERFMQCYPPYWYHLGRTQQALGQLFAAAETYAKLLDLGAGHFRKDEMLASALANQAAIQMFLHQPAAPATARRALEFSNGVWQANLVCARVLVQSEYCAEAEEAILRNLDVDLERTQSYAALISLYCGNQDRSKLAARLNAPELVASLPVPLLLDCAVCLGADKLPTAAQRQLVTSIYVYEQLQFGKNQLVCVAAPSWEMETANVRLQYDGKRLEQVKAQKQRGTSQVNFLVPSQNRTMYASSASQPVPAIDLEIEHPERPAVRLHFKWLPWSRELLDHASQFAAYDADRDLLSRLAPRRRTSYLVTDVEVGASKVAFDHPHPNSGSFAAPAILETAKHADPEHSVSENGEVPPAAAEGEAKTD